MAIAIIIGVGPVWMLSNTYGNSLRQDGVLRWICLRFLNQGNQCATLNLIRVFH